MTDRKDPADEDIADLIRAAVADETADLDLATVIKRAATTTGPGPTGDGGPRRSWLARLLRRRPDLTSPQRPS